MVILKPTISLMTMKRTIYVEENIYGKVTHTVAEIAIFRLILLKIRVVWGRD